MNTNGRALLCLRTVTGRLLHAAALMLGVIVVNFSLVHLAPGDAATVMAGEMGGGMDEERMEAVRARYGLDQPMFVQLGTYISRVVQGDLGESIVYNRSVTSLIADRIWPTVLLLVAALSFAVVVGTLLGVFAARRPHNPATHVVTVFALFGFAAPVFWTALMLLIVFAGRLGWFPIGGMSSLQPPDTVAGRALDTAHHLVLPAFTLGSVYMAYYTRIARSSMRDVLSADYVRTAHAKGASPRSVVYKHGLRNGVIPVVTMAGLQLGALMSGTVIIETIFNWPGMGRLAFEAILRRDTAVLLGCLLTATLVVVIANLLTDASYRLIDPRIRTKSTT